MSTPRTDAQAGWAIANQYGQSTGSELLGATDGVFVHAVFARRLERELATLTAERDQLRAALADPQQLHAHCLRTLNEGQIAHLFGGRMTEIVNRAERAEASLHALGLVCGTTDADKFTTWVDRAIARAELAAEREKSERYRLATLKLDAELATERARLDSGQILLTVAGERVWHCGVDLRAAIDAAMKEDAK